MQDANTGALMQRAAPGSLRSNPMSELDAKNSQAILSLVFILEFNMEVGSAIFGVRCVYIRERAMS